MKLSDFRVLTFDCYGTLIDWEAGLYAALQPLLRAVNTPLGRAEALAHFAKHEPPQQAATPAMLYPELLAEVHRRLARQWGVTLTPSDHVAFGTSVPRWPAFADTPAALQYLKRHYKLVILSNVDRESFAGSNVKLGVGFEGSATAHGVVSAQLLPR